MVAEPLGHQRPGGRLRLAQVLVLVEVLPGVLDRRLQVVQEPQVLGLEGRPVGPRRPLGDAGVAERRAEHVLVEREDDLDAASLGPIQHGSPLVQVGLVVAALGGLQEVPVDAQAQQVEAVIGQVVERLGVGVGGRVAGLDVGAPQLEGAALRIGQVGAPVGARRGAHGGHVEQGPPAVTPGPPVSAGARRPCSTWRRRGPRTTLSTHPPPARRPEPPRPALAVGDRRRPDRTGSVVTHMSGS